MHVTLSGSYVLFSFFPDCNNHAQYVRRCSDALQPYVFRKELAHAHLFHMGSIIM